MKHTVVHAAMAAGLLGVVPAAHAAPTLSLSADGAAPTFCADNASCDLNPVLGAVTYLGSVGAFQINVTTGLSKPLLTGGNPLMDLNTVNVVSGGPHELVIMFS